MFLLACATAAIACFVGPAAGREQRMDRGLRFAVRCFIVVLYALAATHKLNRDFFDPAVSCATSGIEVLSRDWHLAALDTPALARSWAPFFVAAEIGMLAALVLRPGFALGHGLLIHIPLTIVFAPSFTFAVMSGWVACLSEADLRHLGTTLRRRSAFVVAVGGALAALSLRGHVVARWRTDPLWCIDEGLQFFALAWVVAAWWRRPPGALGWFSAWRERPPKQALWIGACLAVIGAVNGFSPYLGVQFQHTAAMLSNLRIDAGCWNSLVFPESMRLTERYIRVDDARVGRAPALRDPDAREWRVEKHLVQTLWNTESLALAKKGWCKAGLAPLHLRGTWLGRSFATDDLCAPGGWPFGDALFPRYRAFQANLVRKCPQKCVH